MIKSRSSAIIILYFQLSLILQLESFANAIYFDVRKQLPNSNLKIFYHEKTAAITEWGNQLLRCELVPLTDKSNFHQLQRIKNPVPVSFNEIIQLINNCQEIDKHNVRPEETYTSRGMDTVKEKIFPGTRWCGAGDIASNYFELGSARGTDICCRAHDFCPVMLEKFQPGYGLINLSLYTKSHCGCDDAFFACLKKDGSIQSELVGQMYFNTLETECFWNPSGRNSYSFRNAKNFDGN